MAVVAGPLAAGEPFQPQDLVISLLGTYVRPFGDTVWSGGLVLLLGEFGFSHGSERSDEGTWTLVWHQIPEARRLERSRLARRLRFLGFGSAQDSVWVSPHDHADEVRELLSELGVEEFATLFRASGEDASGLSAFVSRAWDLSGLVGRYEAFVNEFGEYVSSGAEDGSGGGGSVRWVGDEQAFLVRTRLVHLFREFPVLDPELPTGLAPPVEGPRRRAVKVFHALYEGLASASQRHFDEVTGASPLWR